MESHHIKTGFSLYFISLLVITSIVSCGTTQRASGNDDGIYADDLEMPQRKIIAIDKKEYDGYDENYFTKELERLDNLNNIDIITDIENYKSEDYDFEGTLDNNNRELETQISTNKEPWGYNSSSDVVVNVNTFGGYSRFGWGIYDPFWDPYWERPWSFGWGNRWGRYNSYWYPYPFSHYRNSAFYAGTGGFYNPYYCLSYYNYRYGYRNYRPYRYNYRKRYYNRGYRKGTYKGNRSITTNSGKLYSGDKSKIISRRSSNIYRRTPGNIQKNRSISRNRRLNSVRRKSDSETNRNSGRTKTYNPVRSTPDNNKYRSYRPSNRHVRSRTYPSGSRSFSSKSSNLSRSRGFSSGSRSSRR